MANRKPNGYWTLERCMADAAQYETRKAWAKGSNKSAYNAARLAGWLDDCCQHMERGAYGFQPELPAQVYIIEHELDDGRSVVNIGITNRQLDQYPRG